MSKLFRVTWKLVVVGMWAVALAVAFATTTPKPWTLTILGVSLGCISRYLRSRALRAGAYSSAAVGLTWLSGVGLLILAMAFAEDMFIGAWAASFAGYLLLASVLVLPTISRKQHLGVATDGT